MSAPALAWYYPGGAALIPDFAFTVVTGTPTAAISFELWNANGASSGDTATEVYIEIFERRAGETAWTQLRDVTQNRWIEIQATGATGTATPWTITWQPIGQGRPFLLPPIPFNSGRQLEIRADLPGSAGTDSIELKLVPHVMEPSVPVGIGAYASGLRGITSGLGDGLYSCLIAGGVLTASTVPDANVQVSDLEWVYVGVPGIRLAGPLALSGFSSSGALVAGEAYWATLSVGSSGITVTKSASGASPLATSLRPAVPGQEKLLGWVHREFPGTIGSTAIYNAAIYGRFALQGSGLVRRVGPGLGILDDRILRWDTDRPVTFPASTLGVELYLLPVGDPAVSVSGRPDPRAMLIYRADTGASDLTAITDLRHYLRTRPGMLSFRFDAVLAPGNASRILTFPGDGDGALSVGFSCRASLDDLGTTNTAGSTIFDIQARTGASTWVSLFTSSGTVDRRPTLPYNAAYPYQAEGRPQVLVILKGAELRAVVISIPTGVAAPSGAEVQLFYEVP